MKYMMKCMDEDNIIWYVVIFYACMTVLCVISADGQ